MDQPQRSGFWSTLPGILTGSAALITAATGGYLAFDRTLDKPAVAGTPQAEARAEPTLPVAAAVATPIASASPEVRPAIVESSALAEPPPAAARPAATGVPRPSFNCALASTAIETMVCSDADLADRDRQVAAQYFALRGSLPPNVRSQLLQSQRLFLRQRSDCATSQCLSALYDVRLRQLAEFASN